MTYESIDEIQKVLAHSVFQHTSDRKKAAGRALGTIIEIITYYLIRQWNLASCVTIELRLPEFANPNITHNVEFGLHPCIYCQEYTIPYLRLPITSKKIFRSTNEIAKLIKNFSLIQSDLLSADYLQRNRCLIGRNTDLNELALVDLISLNDRSSVVELTILQSSPFAIFECKRVGVEEGAKKGPTTIEKAKQGAYVAKHVSSLQKIRSADGTIFAALAKPDGSFHLEPYDRSLEWMINDAPVEYLKDFVLTVGIASNHGNWFTAEDPNKELLVLKQSYDWLLFLSDRGLAKFIQDLILNPSSEDLPVRTAFLASYDSPKTSNRKNQFTKVRLLRTAHLVLSNYFQTNIEEIEHQWFNIISPPGNTIDNLKKQLQILAQKDWSL